MGYHRAGFEVVGVDIKPQPRYPFEFHQADALAYPLEGFDVIHASPPCQVHVKGWAAVAKSRGHRYDHVDLIPETRDRLKTSRAPWVIENVPGAPIRPDVVLCGSAFGLEVRRHRWFEASVPLQPWSLSCNHGYPVAGVYGHGRGRRGANPGMLPDTAGVWERAMGIDWMSREGLRQAIPPAYTEWIGAQLMAHLEAPVAVVGSGRHPAR